VAFATRTLWHLPLGTTTRDRSWGWPGVAPALRTQLEGISNFRFVRSGASNRTGLKNLKCPHAATTEQKANEPLSTRGGHTAYPLWVISGHRSSIPVSPLCARSGPTAIRSQVVPPPMRLSSIPDDAASYTFGHDFGRDDVDALKLEPLPSQSSFRSRWHQSFYLPRPTVCESYP